MSTVERSIAADIATFLTARAERIATDGGTLILYVDRGTLMADLDGVSYVVRIEVVRS